MFYFSVAFLKNGRKFKKKSLNRKYFRQTQRGSAEENAAS